MHRHNTKRQTIEPTKVGSAQGKWWRFDRYEIKAGSIQPAADARLHWYDPWDKFIKTRSSNDIQPPYQSLLKLGAQLKFTSGRYPDRVTKASQEAILDWCQEHGPLGVLLSRWEAITLAPQAGEADQFTSARYVHAFGQNVYHFESSGDVGGRKASVLLHGLNDLDLVEETPDKTWSKFFPSVEFEKRNTYAYPPPYTDEFCHLYAERLSFFCNAALLFADAVTHVASARASHVDLESEQALETINLWRRPISAILEWNAKGTPEQGWHTPSLLASFAEMLAQDVTFGRATLLCPCCQFPFVSGAYQARYCSPACRQRHQKRNVRKQAKEAQRLRAQGQTIRQIAAALGQKVHIVKGWLAPKAKR
jgi:transposase